MERACGAEASPDGWQFQGGSGGAPMVHVAVTGGVLEWGEPVSDEGFDEGF